MEGLSVDENFVRFGSKQFAIKNITSFEISARKIKVQGDNKRVSAAILGSLGSLLSLSFFIAGVAGNDLWPLVIGLAFLAFFGRMLYKYPSMPNDGSTFDSIHKIKITTTAGETAAYETCSLSEIKQLEAALSNAIIGTRS